jgi:predicted DNA-binding antitoxin AbrB/MazE fold protein
MTTTIEAVYEGGVFRPTRQIALTEGTRVEVSIPAVVEEADNWVESLRQMARNGVRIDVAADDSREIIYEDIG